MGSQAPSVCRHARGSALALPDASPVLFAALGRAAKGAGWAAGADPLVIDLDGDGIETVAIDMGRVWFDLDGDRFAGRTGWLEPVLSGAEGGNGRIDGISEMFGDRFQGGYAELAQYDSAGDGRITSADAIRADLQVWQDRNQNGVTDAGELSSLDALGIVSLSLASTPIGTTTPQGTQLIAGEVTFASGRVSGMLTQAENDNQLPGEMAA